MFLRPLRRHIYQCRPPVRARSSSDLPIDEVDKTRSLMALLPPLYDHFCRQFDPMLDDIIGVVEAVNPAGPRRILDLATGHGEPACRLAQRYPDAAVIASDFEDGMLVKAEARVADLQLGERVVCRRIDMVDGILRSVPPGSQVRGP